MFHDSSYTDEQQMIAGFAAQLEKDFDNAYFLSQAKEDEFPQKFWDVVVENGFLGLIAEERFGGSAFGSAELVVFLSSMAQAGAGSNVLINQLLCSDILSKYATDHQKEQYLPSLIAGDRWSYANLEQSDGRSVFDFEMTAEADGDNFVLNGAKHFVVGADGAKHLIVAARTSPYNKKNPEKGITLFVVDGNSKNIEIISKEINVRVITDREPTHVTGDAFFEVKFNATAIATNQVIGQVGQGGQLLESIAARQMLMMAGIAIGWGERILDKAIDYANTRVIYEEPIGSYQAVQHPMVHAKTALEMAKLLIRRSAAAYDADDPEQELFTYASIAKQHATEAGYAACDIGIQCHGGSGFDRDTGIITLWPLILLSRLVPLNNDVILERFSEEVLDLPVG